MSYIRMSDLGFDTSLFSSAAQAASQSATDAAAAAKTYPTVTSAPVVTATAQPVVKTTTGTVSQTTGETPWLDFAASLIQSGAQVGTAYLTSEAQRKAAEDAAKAQQYAAASVGVPSYTQYLPQQPAPAASSGVSPWLIVGGLGVLGMMGLGAVLLLRQPQVVYSPPR